MEEIEDLVSKEALQEGARQEEADNFQENPAIQGREETLGDRGLEETSTDQDQADQDQAATDLEEDTNEKLLLHVFHK